jgi:hypothetical protein
MKIPKIFFSILKWKRKSTLEATGLTPMYVGDICFWQRNVEV